MSTSEVRDELNVALHTMTMFSTYYHIISKSLPVEISTLLIFSTQRQLSTNSRNDFYHEFFHHGLNWTLFVLFA